MLFCLEKVIKIFYAQSFHADFLKPSSYIPEAMAVLPGVNVCCWQHHDAHEILP